MPDRFADFSGDVERCGRAVGLDVCDAAAGTAAGGAAGVVADADMGFVAGVGTDGRCFLGATGLGAAGLGEGAGDGFAAGVGAGAGAGADVVTGEGSTGLDFAEAEGCGADGEAGADSSALGCSLGLSSSADARSMHCSDNARGLLSPTRYFTAVLMGVTEPAKVSGVSGLVVSTEAAELGASARGAGFIESTSASETVEVVSSGTGASAFKGCSFVGSFCGGSGAFGVGDSVRSSGERKGGMSAKRLRTGAGSGFGLGAGSGAGSDWSSTVGSESSSGDVPRRDARSSAEVAAAVEGSAGAGSFVSGSTGTKPKALNRSSDADGTGAGSDAGAGARALNRSNDAVGVGSGTAGGSSTVGWTPRRASRESAPFDSSEILMLILYLVDRLFTRPAANITRPAARFASARATAADVWSEAADIWAFAAAASASARAESARAC